MKHRLRVVTCLSNLSNRGYQELLKASCEHYGLELVTLLYRGNWASHRIKDELFALYLACAEPDELIVFTDAYDTVFMCGATEMCSKYQALGKPIVLSAERNCWPAPSMAEQFPPVKRGWRYPNSGGIIGRVGDLRYVLAHARQSSNAANESDVGPRSRAGDGDTLYVWSNQYVWQHMALAHPDLIGVDHAGTMFMTLGGPLASIPPQDHEHESLQDARMRVAAETSIVDGRLYANQWGEWPCHVHFNGRNVRVVANESAMDRAMPWRVGQASSVVWAGK